MTDLGEKQIDELRTFACKLADAASVVTLKFFRTPVDVSNKEEGYGFDPVTQADKGAEEVIRSLIEEHYPDHAIHGEEFGFKKTDSPFEWVLDPVDGTRAFISGLPTWGTLIALKYKGEPIIGIIDQPYIKERYLGWPGGASLNGKPIHTRTCPDLSVATLSTTDANLFTADERPAFDTLLGKVRLTRYGMDCYAYAILSSGFIDIIAESGLQPYDMMALIPVIRGAGGSATNWEGQAPGDCGRLLAVGDPRLQEIASHILTAS